VTPPICRVLVTGAQGFIGKNLVVRLHELRRFVVTEFVRDDDAGKLSALVAQSDAVVHLAGENRPQDERAFAEVNTGLTVTLCDVIRDEMRETRRKVPLILASSIQVERDNAYGKSKLAAEQAVQALAEATEIPMVVFRLSGVFGKWCKPNYNSVVATFCNNIARGLPIQVHDPAASLRLVYVDDVVSQLIAALDEPGVGFSLRTVAPEYKTKLGELASQIEAFGACRTSLQTERVGTGLLRALYATYVSYLPTEQFAYEVPLHADSRGAFVEMLKTPDCGQFSYFTAHPGVKRGSHYHHTKTEKFLVIKGRAMFRFRHILTGQLFELSTSGDKPQVVDSIPGWAHDITNIGDDEMVVMLWANENFDHDRPDTVSCKI
jgi:UDP-2-acetamido-2,6-beta-L-arabino-hexul-4-ose reductase